MLLKVSMSFVMPIFTNFLPESINNRLYSIISDIMFKNSKNRRNIVKFDHFVQNTSIKSGALEGKVANFEIKL